MERNNSISQENKALLLKDLSARLPCGVLCEDMEGKTRPLFGITPTQHFIVTLDNATDGTNGLKFCTIDCVKPYLRPMSSMTEEEWKEYRDITCCLIEECESWNEVDWLNAHHFDYRTIYDEDKKKYMSMIEKGLALEAPKGMYN